MQETQVQSPGWEDPLEKEMVTHSSILAWEIPWTEEPGGLQPWAYKKVRHDLGTKIAIIIIVTLTAVFSSFGSFLFLYWEFWHWFLMLKPRSFVWSITMSYIKEIYWVLLQKNKSTENSLYFKFVTIYSIFSHILTKVFISKLS